MTTRRLTFQIQKCTEEEEAERWKKLVEGFKEKIALSRKTASVLPALQRMVLDVKTLGFPVTRIHGDRAGELRAKQVRKWILGRGILQSYTEGDAPASNGVAEAGVKFIKRRARILLDNAGVDKAHWPDAVRTAAQEQRSTKLGIPSSLAAPFGAKCYVKTKKYKVTAVDDLGPKWMLGRYMGTSADVSGGHVVLKANGQFLQTLNIRLGEEPPRLDDLSPPYFVDEDGLPVPVRRVRHKTKPVTFRTDTEPVGPAFPSSSTAPSPKEAVPGSDTEPVGPAFPSSSTAPSPAERLLIQVQSATVTLKPIRTMIDLVLLRGDLTNEKADTLIASGWSWDQHRGFDVDSVDTYDSLEFHMWSERENIPARPSFRKFVLGTVLNLHLGLRHAVFWPQYKIVFCTKAGPADQAHWGPSKMLETPATESYCVAIVPSCSIRRGHKRELCTETKKRRWKHTQLKTIVSHLYPTAPSDVAINENFALRPNHRCGKHMQLKIIVSQLYTQLLHQTWQ